MSRIAIIGAGAAGCFAAANIEGSHEIIVFEKAAKAMQKVKVSGGGRCNVTHACFEVEELLKRYPRGASLLKRTLYRFGPGDTIEWFRQRGVAIKEEADGRMFPVTDDSQTIIDCIVAAMNRTRVQMRFGKALRDAVYVNSEWQLTFEDSSTHTCDRLLLACGSIQKPERFSWLTVLGHTIQAPAPSLFTFNLPGDPITALMGLSVPNASVKLAGLKAKQSGPVLITHWGLSGPAVLKMSAWAARELQEKNYECAVLINWLGDTTEAALREQIISLRQEQGKSTIAGRNPFGLPKRLWEYFLQSTGIAESTRWGDLAAASQQKLMHSLIADTHQMKGKTTFKEEFVTCGGVTTSEVNPHTMESKRVPGLYFAGEALDVDGVTGGFNFQHAWSSGWIAAKAMSA